MIRLDPPVLAPERKEEDTEVYATGMWSSPGIKYYLAAFSCNL